MCCALMSCGGAKNANTEQQADNKDQTSATEQKNEQQAPAKKADAYTMVDGKVFDLKGKVKSCVIYTYYADENGNPQGAKPLVESKIDFDADGRCTKHSDFEKVVRNDKDQLEKLTWFCSDFGTDFETSYTYNEDGYLKGMKEVTISGKDYVFGYDADNVLVSQSCNAIYEEGVEGKVEGAFRILESDGNGNWTKRAYTEKEGTREMGAADYEWQTSYFVQIRKIEY